VQAEEEEKKDNRSEVVSHRATVRVTHVHSRTEEAGRRATGGHAPTAAAGNCCEAWRPVGE
jgi:hypothetical protein